MPDLKQFIRLSIANEGSQHPTTLRNLQLEPDYPWPPPETLWLIIGHAAIDLGMDPIETGLLVHDAEAFDEIAEKMADLADDDGWTPTYSVAEFKQISCSKLTDEELATMTYVARGAEYVAV